MSTSNIIEALKDRVEGDSARVTIDGQRPGATEDQIKAVLDGAWPNGHQYMARALMQKFDVRARK